MMELIEKLNEVNIQIDQLGRDAWSTDYEVRCILERERKDLVDKLDSLI